MFQSEPICILQAGTTVDGRVIEQKIIDEIAESYDPNVYTARINEEHYDWSYKFGSVVSVEKREDKLFAVIKPNSYLLRMIEQGQLLHTSCEFIEKFSDTDKAYLTGLALTDKPASLGTTQIHLSRQKDGVVHVASHFPVSSEQFSHQSEGDDASMFKKFKLWLKGETRVEPFSQQEDEDEMSKETEALLKQSIEQNQALNSNLSKLVERLSSQDKTANDDAPDTSEDNAQLTELKGQVEQLSSQLTDLTQSLSQLTDDSGRKLAGEDTEADVYL
ncbi:MULTISPECIES: GPO family capsid scaffolding protein [unclassified Vibrio]|uniref:GPO family capsid scaffolding protein n=1 Tax=unclassified Vibrio TaxID=2614977 RepID=UPI001361E303|nr:MULTISPECIES: GPO family capsid scaffolding protein [unclassified Vibrio]NAW59486.1 phage capsid protein [Vibrio sp. V36_P2S2PM302]NAX25443.1 phage capsid protein [Vibrio sp. V38_P2S17PM301]NAX30375.1 phage capsid protein [Vibrio sp. V37_P2S8PM304]